MGWLGNTYKKIDQKLGGVLPGGYVKPKPTTPSSPPSSSSSSGTTTVTTTPATKVPGVRVIDYSSNPTTTTERGTHTGGKTVVTTTTTGGAVYVVGDKAWEVPTQTAIQEAKRQSGGELKPAVIGTANFDPATGSFLPAKKTETPLTQPAPTNAELYGTGVKGFAKQAWATGGDVVKGLFGISYVDVTTPTTNISSRPATGTNIFSPSLGTINPTLIMNPLIVPEQVYKGYKLAREDRLAGLRTEYIQKQQIASIEEYNKSIGEISSRYGTGEISPVRYQAYLEEVGKVDSKLFTSGVSTSKVVTPEGVVTTFSSPQLDTKLIPRYYQTRAMLKEQGRTGASIAYGGLMIGSYAGEAYSVGKVASPLISRVGQTIRYGTSGAFYGKVGQTLGYGAIGVSTAALGYGEYKSARTGYVYAKEAGLSGTEGVITGLTKFNVQTYTFMQGATGGAIPYKPVAFKQFTIGEEGSGTQVTSIYGQAGQKVVPYLTYVKGQGISVGSPSMIKFSGLTTDLAMGVGYSPMSRIEAFYYQKYLPLQPNVYATSVAESQLGYKISSGLKDVKGLDIKQFEFSKAKFWSDISPEQQTIIQSEFTTLAKGTTGFRGLVNIWRGEGLERLYGSSTISAEGGFKTNVYRKNGEFGDIDLVLRGKGAPLAEQIVGKLNVPGGAQFRVSGVSLVEVKTPSGWAHAFDIHGIDNPELMLKGSPFGFEEKLLPTGTKRIYITGTQTAPSQQLGQSLTQKYGSITELRQTPQGLIITSPPQYRIKDVADFVSVSDTLSGMSGGKFAGEIGSYKTLLQVNYPGIQFGSTAVYGSSTGSTLLPVTILPTSPTMASSKSLYSSFSIAPSPSSFASYSSFSMSVSPSGSPSPSVSPSSLSRSFSPSPSPSPSISPSLSMSVSPSPSPSPSPSFSPSPSPSSIPAAPFFLPEGGFFGSTPGRKFKATRRSKYTPSYTALVFGIKGKKPKGILTGVELRPITKGFTFAFSNKKSKFVEGLKGVFD